MTTKLTKAQIAVLKEFFDADRANSWQLGVDARVTKNLWLKGLLKECNWSKKFSEIDFRITKEGVKVLEQYDASNVNKENIQKVIDILRLELGHFNMVKWDNFGKPKTTYPDNVCGTPSCIGGWAESIMMFEKGADPNALLKQAEYEVADWLGLSHSEANKLFYPLLKEDDYRDPFLASREDAIKHLEHVRDGGRVDWDTFFTGTL